MIPQALRYLVVVVLGFVLDLGLAILLVKGGWSTSFASTAGLVCGATSNFIIHRYWTFSNAEPGAMIPQILTYAASVAMILPIRLAVLAMLGYLPVSIDDSLSLFLATGVSFVVNFFVLKRLVFRRRS
jgi:putative flippase GtrA